MLVAAVGVARKAGGVALRAKWTAGGKRRLTSSVTGRRGWAAAARGWIAAPELFARENTPMTAKLRDDKLVVRFEDHEERTFHLSWLRDGCPCPKCVTSSGQKVGRKVDDPALCKPSLSAAPRVVDGAITIGWADHENVVSKYDSAWLRRFAYSNASIEKDHQARSAMQFYSNQVAQTGKHGIHLERIAHSTVVANGDQGVWKWMTEMNTHGAVLISGTPNEEGAVKQVANLIGPCSHTIYGETFDVKATPKPINIAYTDHALEPHMDLSYYESPPGWQMLHCRQFDDGVTGGDSTLIDGHAIAEEFRVREPEHFAVLSTVPATFQKDHMERSFPLKMFYQRPHIATNYMGQVTAVYWSPPFEGPLRVKEDLVQPYYEAYHAFRSLMLSNEMWEKYGIVFRMKPGDLLAFNNRRMLHGRNAFTSANGGRHLQGCYLDVDTVLNKFRVLAVKMDSEQGVLAAPRENRFGTTSHR